MDEHEMMPKGMKKLPEQFEPESSVEESFNHEQSNYSNAIRSALRELEKQDIVITIKRLEMVEEENSPTMASLIFEVRSKK